MHHEQASLALAQRCSGIEAPAPLFTTLMNFRHTTLENARGEDSVWHGVRILAMKDRTNYPITLAVDDFGDDLLLLSAKVVEQVPAESICAYMHTALESTWCTR